MFWRTGMLALSILAVGQISETVARTMPVLGYVAAKNANPKRLEVFKQGLAELGYIEGKNIRIEYREAVLDEEYHSVIAELVDRKIDMILAANVAATRAAARPRQLIAPWPNRRSASPAARRAARLRLRPRPGGRHRTRFVPGTGRR